MSVLRHRGMIAPRAIAIPMARENDAVTIMEERLISATPSHHRMDDYYSCVGGGCGDLSTRWPST